MEKKKIVLALDSFKGSLDSLTAGQACASALEGYETVVVPIADGGEGTVEALTYGLDCRTNLCATEDPLGRTIEASYVTDGETAYVAVAAATGLPLLKEDERSPLRASSYGTGVLIRKAIAAGCRHIILGVGGSASVDGGVGLLTALGFRFVDEAGRAIGPGGGELCRIAAVDSSCVGDDVRATAFTVLCDVDNPLCGSSGAAAVFGPQKGATTADVAVLNAGLAHLASFMPAGVAGLPGAGAAGGIAAGMKAWLNAELVAGAPFILERIGFGRILEGASLVVTGEGRLDATTLNGKAPIAVLRAAQAAGVPCVALGGSVSSVEMLENAGFAAVEAITPAGMNLADAMRRETAIRNLRETVRQIILRKY